MGHKSRYAKLLEPNIIKTSKTVNRTLPWINWPNGAKSGVFTDKDAYNLESSLERAERAAIRAEMRDEGPTKTKNEPTIRSATREELVAALHKATFRGRSGR